MKNVTIKDVAKCAGVSPSTVSRVIANSPRISPETQQRVRDVMKKLGYHHNAIARSLVTQRTNTIGLVLARATRSAFENPFFSGIIQGIASAAQQGHFKLMLSAADDYREEGEEVLNMLRNRRVDGVILLASRVKDELIEQLQEQNYPFVLIGRSLEITDLPLVNNDNIKAAFQAVEYLIKKGYQKTAIISGPEEYVVSLDRLQGVKQALASYEMRFEPSHISYSDFTFEGGYNSALALLQEKEIDSIFAFDDIMAAGALRAAQSQDLKIPDDLAIMGFNDSQMTSYIKPSLTTVKVPIIQMGVEAGRMLIRIIQDKEYQGEKIIIPTEVISREST